jgi:hypothetical protein
MAPPDEKWRHGRSTLEMDNTAKSKKSKLAEALRLIADAIELDEVPKSTPNEDSPALLTDVAHDLGVTLGWLRERIRDGQLPATRGPRQRAYVRRSDARRVLDSSPIEPKRPRKVVDISDPIERRIASGDLIRGTR